MPIAFEWAVDRAKLAANTRHALRGAILVGGRPAWVTEPVAIDPSSAAIDVGLLQLVRVQPLAFASTLHCGERSVTVGHAGDTMRMEAGGQSFDLRPVRSASGAGLVATIFERRCADSMTGMPYPDAVTVAFGGRTLTGCGGDPATLLWGAEWVVEDLRGGGVVDRSRATLAFAADGRVSGRGSCNRYTASYSLTGEGMTVSKPASTMMACAPALMRQEQRFFDLLAQVRRFTIDAGGSLVLHAADGGTITARRP